jgi:hypothetical protein
MVTKIKNSSNHDLEICVIGMEKYNSLGKMEETIISSRQPFLRNKKIKYNNLFEYSKFIHFKVQIFAKKKLIRQDILSKHETWEMTDESFFPEAFIESK